MKQFIMVLTIIAVSLLAFTGGCMGETANQTDILSRVEDQITDNTTVKELVGILKTAVAESENMTKAAQAATDNETAQRDAELGIVRNEAGVIMSMNSTGTETYFAGDFEFNADHTEVNTGYHRLERNMFNDGQLVLVENTPEQYTFQINYYLNGESAHFIHAAESDVYLYVIEGGITPDFSTSWFDGVNHLIRETIDGKEFQWYRIPYTSSDQLLRVNKAEILPSAAEYLTVMVLINPQEFGENDFGQDSGNERGLPISSWVWLTIPNE